MYSLLTWLKGPDLQNTATLLNQDGFQKSLVLGTSDETKMPDLQASQFQEAIVVGQFVAGL